MLMPSIFGENLFDDFMFSPLEKRIFLRAQDHKACNEHRCERE